MEPLPWTLQKIVDTAIELQASGRTGASTGEHIAAAFVLNRQDCLPDDERDLVQAWDKPRAHLASACSVHQAQLPASAQLPMTDLIAVTRLAMACDA